MDAMDFDRQMHLHMHTDGWLLPTRRIMWYEIKFFMRMALLLNNYTNREGVGGNGFNALKPVYIDQR